MVEVVVAGLALDEKQQYPVVILQTKDGSRRLPIWIGRPEASAIAMELSGKRFPRPLTHDLIVSVLKGLGARVQRVEITDLVENTFYAKIYLERDKEIVCVDARPSDSIAVALKTRCPILVHPRLLSPASGDTLAGLAQLGEEEMSPERWAEELRKFIENLDPKDFGKFSFHG
jgi:hypothetical protein